VAPVAKTLDEAAGGASVVEVLSLLRTVLTMGGIRYPRLSTSFKAAAMAATRSWG
jgi:hypothetical protein